MYWNGGSRQSVPFIVLFAATAAASFAATIDFENQCPSDQQTIGPCSALFRTVGNAETLTIATPFGPVKIQGGALFDGIANLPADESVVYGTAGNASDIGVTTGSGFTNPLTITFPIPITVFSLDVLNGNTVSVRYRLSDNRGNSASFDLAPNFSGGLQHIGLSTTGTVVELDAATGQSTSSGITWDFLIDNINFNAVGTPEPASALLIGTGLIALGFARRKAHKHFRLVVTAILAPVLCLRAATAPIALQCPAANGSAGTPYSSAFVGTGGVPPYTYSISTGTLPAGLALDGSTGAITGTPSTPGLVSFTAKVVDSLIPGAGGSPDSTTASCSISIASSGAPVITSLSPPSTIAGSPAFTLTVNGYNFIPTSQVLWNNSPLPTSFVNSNQLQALVGVNLVAMQGNSAVTVQNGAAQSNAVVFAVAAPAKEVTVTITPRGPITLYAGGQVKFKAQVTGANNTTVTWSVTPAGAASGTIAQTGIYNAPASIAKSMNVTVIATSKADPTKSDSTTIVLDPTVITQVEFTQSIQQLQTLADLTASLNASGQPPVPMVATKLAALRVYTPPGSATFTIEATLPGMKDPVSKSVQLSADPNGGYTNLALTVTSERNGAATTRSPAFAFQPPAGDWTATLNVFDTKKNLIQGPGTFQFKKSPAQNKLKIFTLAVCDAAGAGGCPKASDIGKLALTASLQSYLGDMMPTHAIEFEQLPDKITVLRSDYVAGQKGDSGWFSEVLKQLGKAKGDYEAKNAPPAGTMFCFLGLARAAASDSVMGQAGGIGNRVALALVEYDVFGNSAVAELWAHEIGHALGLRHTNKTIPNPTTEKPFFGCRSLAWDPTTYWLFPDNHIQTFVPPSEESTQIEVGFRPRLLPSAVVKFANEAANEFDVMGYCWPRWISPVNYNRAATFLTVPAPAPGPKISSRITTSSIYLEVSGNIVGGAASIDPLSAGTVNYATGTGSYHIRLLDSSAHTLYDQPFDPVTPIVCDETGNTLTNNPYFFTTIPAVTGATKLVVLDPSFSVIGSKTLGGIPPKVTITHAAANVAAWTIIGSGTNFVSKVELSPDNGNTWIELGSTTGNSVQIDASTLPPSTSAVVRIWVSDGANVGVAISPPFTVQATQPSDASITSPPDNSYYGPDNIIEFTGGAIGFPVGSVQWSSNIDGPLGSGTLYRTLSPGRQTIAMTAGSLTQQVHLGVAVGPPAITIQISANTAGCPVATVHATPDPNVPLVSQTPSPFLVTGHGEVTVLANATDAAGQVSTATATVAVPSSCGN
jgi:hypothetical protein